MTSDRPPEDKPRETLRGVRFLPVVAAMLFLVIPKALSGQVPAACQTPNIASPAQLRSCITALNARRIADSVSQAGDHARIDSLVAANHQIQLTLEDINRRLPPDGRTVVQYVDSAAVRRDTTRMIVNGDLILNGRLCIPDACIGDAGEQIQIRAAKGAGILFQANRDGKSDQSACAGISSIGMSPDLGLRLVQNQRWTTAGERVDFICHDHPTGSVGYDSQAEWSFNGQKPGQPPLGTQRLVIRTDEAARVIYFATWAEGWKVQFRGSSDGCKWCENVRWTVPYQ